MKYSSLSFIKDYSINYDRFRLYIEILFFVYIRRIIITSELIK
nr:MAG TPA: hypothetical protein [Caudoviricetes sp.]